jgi:hypothetical protein
MEADGIVATGGVAGDVAPSGRQAKTHPKSVVKLGVGQGGVRSGRSQQERRGLSSARRGSAEPAGVVERVPGTLGAATGCQPSR